ncbi:MAG: AAA family ATPase, partial [Candidatus Pacebacteria bacterium]|nr:AAA family ATPase [Candidatus Paceibacterota bacterium]
MFVELKQYIEGFLDKTSGNKMVIIPGFRGVGKTTMMAQVCAEFKNRGVDALFLSVEDAKNLFDAGIADLMAAYQEISGNDLESLPKPLLVFFDEIQIDPKWAVSLKSLFEKTSNIFFCGTGSSAVILQTTPNLARRAIFEKMPPMCFSEYEMVKNNIFPPKLKEKIRRAVYFSKNAGDVYAKLLEIKPAINQYWAKVNRSDIKKYLAHGTLPFTMAMPNDGAVYDSISLLLEKIIKLDLPTLASFSGETLGAVKRILFAIAENDTTS